MDIILFFNHNQVQKDGQSFEVSITKGIDN
jgi:hypothetical protein